MGTKQNVIAALNVDNGDIVWRRILEKSDRGSIQYLKYLGDDDDENGMANSLRVPGRQEPDRFMVTVTGTSFVLVRIWNIRTGNLAFEWNFQANGVANAKSHWFSTTSTIYHVQTTGDGANVQVTGYNIKTGYVETTIPKLPTFSSSIENCDFVQAYAVCYEAGEVYSINLEKGTKKAISQSPVRHKVVKVSVTMTFI